MPGMTELFKESASIAAAPIHPASLNGAQLTGAVDMSKFHRVVFVGGVGTLGGSATIDAVVTESNESNGANGTNVSGTNITTINTANKHFTIEVDAAKLTKRYIVCSITVGTAASVIYCVPLGVEPRHHAATGSDHASVAQRLAVA